MKSIKTMIFGLIALGACAAAANATTVRIYINGSTAFRTTAVAQIEALYAGGANFSEIYAGSSDTGQDAAIYSGVVSSSYDSNTPTLIIKTSWLGSESGVQAVADAQATTTANFLQDSPTTAVQTGTTALPALGTHETLTSIDDPTVLNADGTIGTAHVTFDSETPTACFSDTFQATSQYNANASIKYTTTGVTHTFNALTGATVTDGSNALAQYGYGIVAVVPFMFESTTDSALTNVTTATAQLLYKSGFLPRAMFTGVTSDTNVRVYATGRNPDSGTRLTTFDDIGSGALATVKQYQPFDGTGAAVTGSNDAIATIELWPVDTVNQISIAAGNSGFDSSTYLGNALGNATASMKFVSGVNHTVSGPTGGDIIGYVTAKAQSGLAASGSGQALLYNGYAPTALNVINGVYGFWTYEHLYYTSSIVTSPEGDQQFILDSLANLCSENASVADGAGVVTAPLSVDVMNVQRGTSNSTDYDGQAISPTYSGY